MKKYNLGCLMLAVVFLLLCGCSDGLEKEYILTQIEETKETVNLTVDNTTPYDQLITKEIDIHEFAERYTANYIYGGVGIQTVAKDMGIECLRQTQDGATIYSVHKVKQGGLLYLFYFSSISDVTDNYINEGQIHKWYYVRDRLSYSDFEDLIKNEATVEDVIKLDETARIFKNIYLSYDERLKRQRGEYMVTNHYLEDGVLELAYKEEDGEFIISQCILREDYELERFWEIEGKTRNCNGKVLEIDRIN